MTLSNSLSKSSFNLHLSEAQLSAFELYSHYLIAWNERVNLTGIVAPEDIVSKHFVDSLSVCLALSDLSTSFSLIDVGTGAGFPGLPLRIALPQIQLTLVESTAKKTQFLRYVVKLLQLEGVTIVTTRAEQLGQQLQYRENFDVAVARAVANLSTLAEYTMPLVKVGGSVIAQKGQYPIDEVEAAANAIKTLGGKVDKILPVDIPGLAEARHLVVIQKINSTPERYPRRIGVPTKRPL